MLLFVQFKDVERMKLPGLNYFQEVKCDNLPFLSFLCPFVNFTKKTVFFASFFVILVFISLLY